MANISLKWAKQSETEYDIYVSNNAGDEYILLDKVPASGNKIEEYSYMKNYAPENIQAVGMSRSISISWEKVKDGAPETYKIVPYENNMPTFQPYTDKSWMKDQLPPGAIPSKEITWSNFCRSGTRSIEVYSENGIEEINFYSDMSIINDQYILTWIYIDPEAIPDTIVISLHDNDWEHRAYWGKHLLKVGKEGTSSMVHMGAVPSPATWVPIVLDKNLLNVKSINGFSITLLTGDEESLVSRPARVYVDSIFYSNQQIIVAEQPHIIIDYYTIKRRRQDNTRFQHIGNTNLNLFIDHDAPDIFGHMGQNFSPVFSFYGSEDGQSMKIEWSMPLSTGTTYHYIIQARDQFGEEYAPVECTASVHSSHGHVAIYAGESSDYDSLPIIGTSESSSFIHEGLKPDTNYYYKIETFDTSGNLISTTKRMARTKAGSKLDFFILDISPLA